MGNKCKLWHEILDECTEDKSISNVAQRRAESGKEQLNRICEKLNENEREQLGQLLFTVMMLGGDLERINLFGRKK